MNKLLLLAVLATNWCVRAQVTIASIADLKPESTERVERHPDEFYKVYLPMPYGSAAVTDSAVVSKLRGAAIYRIDLVYTRYRGSERFSQRNLNLKRLVRLQQLLPDVFLNSAIDWHLIEEAEETDKMRAQQLFHGFVFYIRGSRLLENGNLRELTTEDEIAYIKAKLALDSVEKAIASGEGLRRRELICWNEVPGKRKFIPWSKKKRAKGILYDRRTILRRRPKQLMDSVMVIRYVTDSTDYRRCLYLRDRHTEALSRYRFDPVTSSGVTGEDTVVQALSQYLHREVIVVEDVTGSMFPYITQTFAWRRLHVQETTIDRFTFFNDGDYRPDGPIGESGGAYHLESDSIAAIEELAFATMRKGNGGGAPENNIESALHAREALGEQRRILMIADNLAPIRDKTLLPQLVQSGAVVDVILCGTAGRGINRDYLQLVRATNGTIYTMESELKQLADLHEGETFTIGKQTFVISGGNVLVKH